MRQFLILFSAVLIQCSWGYGSSRPDGVGVFVYEDSAGHRYECVYKPKVNQVADSPVPSNVNKINEVTSDNANWPDVIFNNIENQQRAAFEAAQNPFGPFNAFPYIPYVPNFNFRFPPIDQFNHFGRINPGSVDMSGINSAFASGAVGPGYRHQVASINPENPRAPNVDVSSQYPLDRDSLDNRFYSVSSSSFVSSVNDNGQNQQQRGAETVVNDNGKITRYSVRN